MCHAASVNSEWRHILELVHASSELRLGAIFGPQHGLYGFTQANMVEWDGSLVSEWKAPLYSLYGSTRTPTAEMLTHIDALVIDLMDVGARPYTYIWTIKNCLHACSKAGIPVWVLDRPNPIAALDFDGPVCPSTHFSFVGGAEIPLCHRLTLGELASLLAQRYFPSLRLSVVWMQGWHRNSFYSDFGLPWIMPSPNIPTLDTARVYPGMVLFEATNISEGRGTTRPFELFGAPFLDCDALKSHPHVSTLSGCHLRRHDFLPTFDKWQGQYCRGAQLHVTHPRRFHPVHTAVVLLDALWRSCGSHVFFNPPPYEYEYKKMPIDILTGTPLVRKYIVSGTLPDDIRTQWQQQYREFEYTFRHIRHYSEEPQCGD